MKSRFIQITLLCISACSIKAQQVDYSVISVKEESGIEFTKITTDNDYVCLPLVKRNSSGVNWYTNRILDISADGNDIAYLSSRNNTTNIFIKDLSKQGSSVQRTKRQHVLDFSYSPDGKNICFSESSGKNNQIFQTNSKTGYICRQITGANKDYSPVYSSDMSQIFFARQELKSISIWSYNIENNFLSSLTDGMNPFPLEGTSSILCTRTNSNGKNEIWKVDYNTGIEECIVSDPTKSFTSPQVSPDGNWILFVGSNGIPHNNSYFYNTDLFVCRLDGTELLQLTYHAADDLSPVWSKDGRFIYFISQRGSNTGTANIWRMTFVY
jgi:Tol biopolymer transport system component